MKTRKKYGQHFLEATWARKLADAIAPAATDRFLEIGPGPGALTYRLAPEVAHLTAVEVDPEMIAALRSDLPPNVTLVEQDFLDFDLAAIARASPEPLRIAGNLPYNISSPILFKLLRAHREQVPLADATLMLQREVADRIEAQPGTKEYGTLSIFVQRRARVRRRLEPAAGRLPPRPEGPLRRPQARLPRTGGPGRRRGDLRIARPIDLHAAAENAVERAPALRRGASGRPSRGHRERGARRHPPS